MCYKALLFLLILAAPLLGEDIPQPDSLSVGWWSAFTEDEENEGHIEKLIEELKGLEAQLSQKEHPLTFIEIERLILAAQKLQEARTSHVSHKPFHPLYLERYQLSDWLQVVESIRSLQDHIEMMKGNRNTITAKIQYLRNELDLMQVEYPMLKEGTKEKLQLGLKIMQTRFRIEGLIEEDKKLLKKQSFAEEDLAKLTKEKQIAEERLDLSNIQEAPIKDQIAKATNLMIQANEQLLNLEKKPQSETENGIDLLSARIQLDLIRSLILFEEIKLLFVQKDPQTIEQSLYDLKRKLYTQEVSIKDLQNSLNTSLGHAVKMGTNLSQIEDWIEMTETNLANSELLISKLETRIVKDENPIYRYAFLAWRNLQTGSLALYDGVSFKLFRINDYPVTLWVLIRALLFFFGSLLLAEFSVNRIKGIKRLRSKIGMVNVYILTRIIYYALIILGILIACYSLGFQMTNFVIIAGALGVGVGLGLQSIVNNFFSGLVVLFAKVLKVGDIIETEDNTRGRVSAINMQNIQVTTFDGKDIIIPNADLITKSMTNWTMADPYVRLHIPFSIEYGTDKEMVEKLVLEVAEKFPFTILNEKICPKPKVWLSNLGDSGLEMELIVWVNIKETSSRGSMTADYLWEIEKTLLDNDIEIPFPQTDIHIRSMPKQEAPTS